jgi:hypothetical protein
MTYRTERLTVAMSSCYALCLALAIIMLLPVSSWAHGFAGKRFFPTTFQVDDPFIGDEFSILFNQIKSPDAKTTEFDMGYSKRILPNFGIEFGESYQHLSFPEGGAEIPVPYECRA